MDGRGEWSSRRRGQREVGGRLSGDISIRAKPCGGVRTLLVASAHPAALPTYRFASDHLPSASLILAVAYTTMPRNRGFYNRKGSHSRTRPRRRGCLAVGHAPLSGSHHGRSQNYICPLLFWYRRLAVAIDSNFVPREVIAVQSDRSSTCIPWHHLISTRVGDLPHISYLSPGLLLWSVFGAGCTAPGNGRDSVSAAVVATLYAAGQWLNGVASSGRKLVKARCIPPRCATSIGCGLCR
ncbi:hypothetical protein C8Q72DRAFT_42975 [Fomitopsis betulina]|nr:hypothetical protein C8Q72DRAFT_42975 [Fomitopsis betulina]